LANDHAALLRISRLFSAATADMTAWEVSSMNAVSWSHIKHTQRNNTFLEQSTDLQVVTTKVRGGGGKAIPNY